MRGRDSGTVDTGLVSDDRLSDAANDDVAACDIVDDGIDVVSDDDDNDGGNVDCCADSCCEASWRLGRECFGGDSDGRAVAVVESAPGDRTDVAVAAVVVVVDDVTAPAPVTPCPPAAPAVPAAAAAARTRTTAPVLPLMSNCGSDGGMDLWANTELPVPSASTAVGGMPLSAPAVTTDGRTAQQAGRNTSE